MYLPVAVNESILGPTVGAGQTLSAMPGGSQPAAAGTPAGAAPGAARACLFCRYRRTDGQRRAASNGHELKENGSP